MIGWQQLLIILIIVVVLFGGTKIATLGRSSGRAIREFKEELRGPQTEQAHTESPPPVVVQPPALPPSPTVTPDLTAQPGPTVLGNATEPGRADIN